MKKEVLLLVIVTTALFLLSCNDEIKWSEKNKFNMKIEQKVIDKCLFDELMIVKLGAVDFVTIEFIHNKEFKNHGDLNKRKDLEDMFYLLGNVNYNSYIKQVSLKNNADLLRLAGVNTIITVGKKDFGEMRITLYDNNTAINNTNLISTSDHLLFNKINNMLHLLDKGSLCKDICVHEKSNNEINE